MHAGCPDLGPTHMQTAGGELDVVPAQNHKLAGPQPVAVGNEDGGCVPMPPAVAASAVHESSISRSVRYSRGRRLATVTFTAVEGCSSCYWFSMIIAPLTMWTVTI